jgi:hypothetical protein
MSCEEIEAGDMVIINDDKDFVKKKQKDHGDWQANMEHVSC